MSLQPPRALPARSPARTLPAWADVLLVATLGALQTLPFVHTAWWPLQWLCITVLAQRVLRASVRRAALLGLAFGTAWLVAGVWWLFVSMHRYGNLPAWLAALAVLALALALAIYPALAMAAAARWRSGSVWRDMVCFSAAWLLAELARTWLFTGFPWLASGYAQVDSPLAVLAPWVGVLGIGAVLAALAVLWAQAASHRAAAADSAVALVLAAWAGPSSHSKPGATLSVSLLQTNVPQDEKFVIEQLPHTLRALAADLASARGQLVIAPETAVPLLPSQLDELAPGYRAALAERFGTPARAAIIGVPLGDYDRGYSNSVIGLTGANAAAAPYRYDKQHLVPFGEFIPTGFRWFTTLLNIPLGDFMRGVGNPPSFVFAGERIAPNICYEDLYRRRTRAAFRRRRERADDVRQPEQHRLVRRHHRDRAAPEHFAHANTGVSAADAARHQHRCDGDHRPPRHRGGQSAALRARRARGAGAGAHRHHALRVVGVARRAVALPGAGRAGLLVERAAQARDPPGRGLTRAAHEVGLARLAARAAAARP